MNDSDHPDKHLDLSNPAEAVTAPLTPKADCDPEPITPSALPATALTALPPGSGGLTTTQSGGGVPVPCLYFLVCQASAGPLKGLFKMGIADCLALRYQQHRKVWGAFDLSRSALLRVGDRWDARRLELALRDALGGSVTEGSAGAVKPWSTADFVARKSWRRYPGRRDEGYTEFYAVECLDRALAFAEQWLGLCGERLTGARIQRGIDSAECALGPGGEGGAASSGRDRGPGLHERQRIRREREYAELEEQVVGKMTRALSLALEYEERLLWVDLRGWQRRRREPLWFRVDEGLVDLYFDRFDPVSPDADAGPHVRFEDLLVPIVGWAASTKPERWRVVGSREVCSFCDLGDLRDPDVPHAACARALRLRVKHELSDLEHPLLAQYEALTRRVQDRYPWRQPELGW